MKTTPKPSATKNSNGEELLPPGDGCGDGLGVASGEVDDVREVKEGWTVGESVGELVMSVVGDGLIVDDNAVDTTVSVACLATIRTPCNTKAGSMKAILGETGRDEMI